MNITLIGMSGVGKSRIGRLMSKKLNYTFIDIDRIIERGNGKKLQSIIDCLGDEEFLKLEENAIMSIEEITDSVISPGGSSIYSDRAMTFLKSISKIVFLNASLEEIKRRPIDFSKRGIVGFEQKGLDTLFEERLPLYKRYADVTIDLKDFNKEYVVDMIIEAVLNSKKE
jgi:shikimate kinase